MKIRTKKKEKKIFFFVNHKKIILGSQCTHRRFFLPFSAVNGIAKIWVTFVYPIELNLIFNFKFNFIFITVLQDYSSQNYLNLNSHSTLFLVYTSLSDIK